MVVFLSARKAATRDKRLLGRFLCRSTKEPAIGKNSSAIYRSLMPARVPLCANVEQRSRRKEKCRGTEVQTPGELAGTILNRAEKRREKEATETSRCTNQAGENADAFRETLRNQLEDRAVAHSQHSHG